MIKSIYFYYYVQKYSAYNFFEWNFLQFFFLWIQQIQQHQILQKLFSTFCKLWRQNHTKRLKTYKTSFKNVSYIEFNSASKAIMLVSILSKKSKSVHLTVQCAGTDNKHVLLRALTWESSAIEEETEWKCGF